MTLLAAQRRIGQNDLERLVGNLCSIHNAVPVVVAHLYHIQRALVKGLVYQAYIFSDSYWKIVGWHALVVQTEARTMHRDDVVCRDPTHLGFYDALGLGDGVVRLDPLRYGHSLLWHNPWPPDILNNLVSMTNPEGQLANSDFEISALNLQKPTIIASVPSFHMAAPRSG